jgi:hypothetical protein
MTIPNSPGKPMSYALIQPSGAGIRWTDRPDFTLTDTAGMLLSDGDTLVYEGDFANWRCIAASGTPSVFIYKYNRQVT